MVSQLVSLAFLIIFLYIAPPVSSSLNDEGLALLSFKQTIESEGYLNSWNDSDDNPCSWDTVTCRKGNVFSLSIPNKKLSGFLPPVIEKLSALRHLNLRDNNFSGVLPVELFNVVNLQSLVLSGNSFSGPVPTQIKNLKYLQVLDLSQNLFTGSIPSTLIQCKRLKTLILNQNNFTGSLPDGFGTNLVALQKLNLSFNTLSGLIPDDISNLSNLKGVLDLSHNLFNGSIPESLGKLAEKVYIDLSYNNLSKLIPQNSALLNLGPTAFIGNPSLCGAPLKTSCPYSHLYSKPLPDNPSQSHSISCKLITIVVVVMIIGICSFGLLFRYWYKNTSVGSCRFEEKLMIRKEISCFSRNERETQSETIEFVALDSQVEFDLEQLLKASAFLLGKSRIGIVYKVVLNNGYGPAVAVRRFGNGGLQRFKEFQTEVEAIGKIRHPNIVSLRAYFWSIDEKLLIYDYIPNGNLAAAIHGKAGTIFFRPISWAIRLRIIKGIAKGLAFLHECSSRRYVHGDLKTSSILLGQNMEPYISDFGLGRLANIAEETLTVEYEQTPPPPPPQGGSPHDITPVNSTVSTSSYYQAPEASKVRKPSQKWDVYSYGVILLEMISGKLPMVQISSMDMNVVQWIQLILEDKKPMINVLDPHLAHHRLDQEEEDQIVSVLTIALGCTHKSPDKRPSMRYICSTLDRLT